MNNHTQTEKNEFKVKSENLQNTAWEMKHKSEAAYELGKFELALSLDEAYCRIQEDSNYFHKLSY